MEIVFFVIIGSAILIIIYGIIIYNNFVTLKHQIKKAWANIDVLLKQRHDELTKLVETCQQYMKYEQETLEKVIKARSEVYSARQNQDITSLGKAETNLRTGLGSLFALAESYPELKANDSFLQLQNRISMLENSIADRRELYNDSVNRNNTRIEQFPDHLIAGRYHFKPATLLEFSDAEKADINIKSMFNS